MLVAQTGDESGHVGLSHRTGVGGIWVGRGAWEGELWDILSVQVRDRCVSVGGLSACADVLVSAGKIRGKSKNSNCPDCAHPLLGFSRDGVFMCRECSKWVTCDGVVAMSPLALLGSCMLGGKLKIGVSEEFLKMPEGVSRIKFGTEMRVENLPEWEAGWK